ncbi:MAG TPA: hypothetical protein VHV10_06535, partial [Ktedonobacteraceae bacterium]|nr:hypothetical protein [Ktedonobacteraceae bacterium]
MSLHDVTNSRHYVDPDHLHTKANEVQQKADKPDNKGFSSNRLRRAEEYNVKIQEENVNQVLNNQRKLTSLVPKMRE